MSLKDGFIHLPNEYIIYQSPKRTALSLKPVNSKESFSVSSNGGQLYLTNQRIVYLPSSRTEEFQSFAAPLLKIHDSHVSAPFFGPNVWTAVVQPVPGGGIPPSIPALELKATFKDGGAFDFHSNFERIKERLHYAVEQAQESGAPGTDHPAGIDYTNVHLDELPAYDGPGISLSNNAEPAPDYPGPDQPPPFSPTHVDDGTQFETSAEPPPGYEEVQQQSVANDLEERLRRGSS